MNYQDPYFEEVYKRSMANNSDVLGNGCCGMGEDDFGDMEGGILVGGVRKKRVVRKKAPAKKNPWKNCVSKQRKKNPNKKLGLKEISKYYCKRNKQCYVKPRTSTTNPKRAYCNYKPKKSGSKRMIGVRRPAVRKRIVKRPAARKPAVRRTKNGATGNLWIDFIKDYSNTTGVSYRDAMMSPKVKKEYLAFRKEVMGYGNM